MLNILNRLGIWSEPCQSVGMRGDMPHNPSGGQNGLADSQATVMVDYMLSKTIGSVMSSFLFSLLQALSRPRYPLLHNHQTRLIRQIALVVLTHSTDFRLHSVHLKLRIDKHAFRCERSPKLTNQCV